MNKVKYPDKKVIQQQICTIIDRSGMFDEQQDSQMFTEIKPVSRKHSYTRTAFKVVKAAAAAAAAVIVVTAVHGAATGIASKKQKALAPEHGKVNIRIMQLQIPMQICSQIKTKEH